ncbi:hypothetical protein BCV71DRAFT_238695 [Rhizopus microsporus]|uniref:Uncharacterized protein n=1 Tax=Rhizopus microsporus TaxID=58291 RepID=A0A1X0RQ80_RHIZD|nr:hypothetical protein BCV71DRAFT_238695 [Rhizopus microsporus]
MIHSFRTIKAILNKPSILAIYSSLEVGYGNICRRLIRVTYSADVPIFMKPIIVTSFLKLVYLSTISLSVSFMTIGILYYTSEGSFVLPFRLLPISRALSSNPMKSIFFQLLFL